MIKAIPFHSLTTIFKSGLDYDEKQETRAVIARLRQQIAFWFNLKEMINIIGGTLNERRAFEAQNCENNARNSV